MTLALVIMGLLSGVALSVTVALFGILSMGGHFQENLLHAMAEGRMRLTGRNRRAQASASARSPESDARLRALQEEVKVMQRLMEQARGERQSHADSAARAGEEIAALRAAVAAHEEKVATLEAALQAANEQSESLRQELSGRAVELASSRRDLKDLQTELGVVVSGAGLTSYTEEIARLRRERDGLTARLAHLQAAPPVTQSSVEKSPAFVL